MYYYYILLGPGTIHEIKSHPSLRQRGTAWKWGDESEEEDEAEKQPDDTGN